VKGRDRKNGCNTATLYATVYRPEHELADAVNRVSMFAFVVADNECGDHGSNTFICFPSRTPYGQVNLCQHHVIDHASSLSLRLDHGTGQVSLRGSRKNNVMNPEDYLVFIEGEAATDTGLKQLAEWARRPKFQPPTIPEIVHKRLSVDRSYDDAVPIASAPKRFRRIMISDDDDDVTSITAHQPIHRASEES